MVLGKRLWFLSGIFYLLSLLLMMLAYQKDWEFAQTFLEYPWLPPPWLQ